MRLLKKIRRGFTLIELLVVIAIIALLLAIIMPALQTAKELATGAICLHNQQQLCVAWTAYANENDGYLVGGSNYYAGSRSTPYRWVEFPLYNDYDNPETTPVAGLPDYSEKTRKNGIRAGKLFPYTGDEDLYHCPGDRTNVKNEEPFAVFRSYSITGLMNGEHFEKRQSGLYSPIVYREVQVSPGGQPKKLKVAIKATDIRSPGSKLVFVEEDVVNKDNPQNKPMGGFVLFEDNLYGWWDAPAYFHNDSGTVGFADGHAERHKWQDPDTLALIKEQKDDPRPDQNEDLRWMVQGYIPMP